MRLCDRERVLSGFQDGSIGFYKGFIGLSGVLIIRSILSNII